MNRVSVVTVTLNNAAGLAATLRSLAALSAKPFEVVVIDGGSRDQTGAVIDDFRSRLQLSYRSEADDGIYDAMNKGRRLARGELVHYLNAGDAVFGEPYAGVTGPTLLPVHILDEGGAHAFDDFVKHGGYGYCHQGVIFPRDHPEYRTRFRVMADLDAIIATFPEGLWALPRCASGGVKFGLGGLSSTALAMRDAEVTDILKERLPWVRSLRLRSAIALKNLVPRPVRRSLARVLSRPRMADK